MCLAIPATIKEKIGESTAVVEVLGVTRKISLDLTPDAKVGDWVLMHAGFAIDIVDEGYANETFELIKSIQFSDDGGTVEGLTPVPFEGEMYGGIETFREAAIASGATRDESTVQADATSETVDDAGASKSVVDPRKG